MNKYSLFILFFPMLMTIFLLNNLVADEIENSDATPYEQESQEDLTNPMNVDNETSRATSNADIDPPEGSINETAETVNIPSDPLPNNSTEDTAYYEDYNTAPTDESVQLDKETDDTIVITGTRSPHILEDVPIETNVITNEEFAGYGINTVAEAIRWIPGIYLSGGATFGSSRRLVAMIQGLPAHETMVLLDGHRLKGEHIHTGINIATVPISLVDRIEVIKGASSSLYGSNALGGVINIITNPIPEDLGVVAEVNYGNYNTINTSVGTGYSFENFGYYVFGSYAQSDGIDDNWYKLGNVNAKLAYQVSDSHRIGLDAFYYYNTYVKFSNEGEDHLIDAALDWTYEITNEHKLNTRISNDYFMGSLRDCHNLTTQFDLTYQGMIPSINSIITSGVEVRRESFERTAVPEKEEYITGVFFQNEFFLFEDTLDIIASLRLDASPEFDAVLTPKFGIMYTLLKNTKFRGFVGEGFRAPTLQDRYEYHFDHRFYVRDGNPDLKPEHSISYRISVEHSFFDSFSSNQLSARVGYFRNDFKDLIIEMDTGEVIPNPDPEGDDIPIFRRENIAEAYTQGVEAEIRYSFLNYISIIAAYTFLDTKNKVNDNVLSYAPTHLISGRIYANTGVESYETSIMFSTEYALDRYYVDRYGENNTAIDDYVYLTASINQQIYEYFSVYIRAENLLNKDITLYEEGRVSIIKGITFVGGARFIF